MCFAHGCHVWFQKTNLTKGGHTLVQMQGALWICPTENQNRVWRYIMFHRRVYQVRSIPSSQHLKVPFLCHLMCGSLGWVLLAHRGTAGSWGRPGGGSQRPPCTRHTHALCTWSYLEDKVSIFGLLMLLKTDWVWRKRRKTITLIMQNQKWTYILA